MSTNNNQEKQRVILSLTVEIQDGREEHIQVKEGDSAEMVAKCFVNQHGLPQQFEAPLAELIVDNIIRLSKDDGWRKENQRPATAPARPTRREAAPASKSESSGKQPGTHETSAANKAAGKTKSPPAGKMSERLLAHTYTFRAKSSVFCHLEPRKKTGQRPLTEKQRALYLRLHMDFVRHKQKMEDGRRLLHEQFVEKVHRNKTHMSKRSRMIMRVRSTAAKQFHNYGELLYQEGMNKQHERKVQIQKKKQEDEANELNGFTFRPELSKTARKQKNKKVVWKRLLEDRYAEHLQQLRNEAFEAQLMECTFKPRINEILRTDRDNREDKLQQQQLGSRFDQLFWDAEIRRRRQAEYTQWYPEGVTFRPSISKSQRSHPDTHEREPGRSVFDRLLEYAERTNLLKQKLLDEFSKPIDPSTGQELFTPITGRKPQVERNASFLPIGEFLYQMYFDLDHKKQAKFEKSLHQTKIKTLEYVLPRSIDILKELEKRSFRQIFDYLDTNKSGIVNLETAVTEALMDDVIEDIEDMKKSGNPVTSLNYEGFVQMLMPIRKAKRRGVHLVLKTRRIDDPFKTFTFRFRMSPYSRALAIKRRKYK
ncbi:hypothetical protein SELMODRAFT_404706 [Selaginella moellendorffii]|uniref:EF-hand domain-containing protein n=1 Tax=Selaginella moellendorffii TaxID=88036 RepID=D8QW55_SELML|nr:hypothetical protein SELMODRAFT_404706 [Selaginella moellendorffii]